MSDLVDLWIGLLPSLLPLDKCVNGAWDVSSKGGTSYIQLKFYRRLALNATDLSLVYRAVEIHDPEKLGKKALPSISFILLLGHVGAPPTRGEDSESPSQIRLVGADSSSTPTDT